MNKRRWKGLIVLPVIFVLSMFGPAAVPAIADEKPAVSGTQAIYVRDIPWQMAMNDSIHGPSTENPSVTAAVLDASTQQVKITRNIEYGRASGTSLFLDIYTPQKPLANLMPAIIWIHGGSWYYGDKYVTYIKALAEQGFFGVSINYRLSGKAAFPAAVEDAKCAVRWLKANAQKYSVNPDRIGVWGESAGGHLAMMVGCADETAGLEGNGGWAGFSSKVQAVCSFYGVSDLTAQYEYYQKEKRTTNIALNKFMDGTPKQIPDIYALGSPITHVTADDPPLLLIHGDRDQTVPFVQSEMMHTACQRLGLDSTLVKVTGAGHGFGRPARISPSPAEIQQAVIDFFKKHLVDA
ncbi:MAG: alpha/beta hydrolase [Dehalococcoidia bacterium]